MADPPVQEEEAEVESEPEPEPNKRRSRGRHNRRLAENRARAYAIRKRDKLQLMLRHLAKEVRSFLIQARQGWGWEKHISARTTLSDKVSPQTSYLLLHQALVNLKEDAAKYRERTVSRQKRG